MPRSIREIADGAAKCIADADAQCVTVPVAAILAQCVEGLQAVADALQPAPAPAPAPATGGQ